MKIACLCVAVLLSCSPAFARTIMLVTPKGVYQSEVKDGVPGPWTPADVDVIVQGFGNVPPDKPPVDPPPADPVVAKVSEISRSLKDKSEATGLAALVDSLGKLNLTPAKFREALELAVPIADVSLNADGRYETWLKAVLPVTSDAAKLKAGLVAAWGIELSSLDGIHSAATRAEGAAIPEEAFNFAAIIAMIEMILRLLKTLGFI